MNTELTRIMVEAIERLAYVDGDGDCFYVDAFLDHDDQLTLEQLKKIQEDDDPHGCLCNILAEMESNYNDSEATPISLNDLKFPASDRTYIDMHREEAETWLNENTWYRLDQNHFLDQTVCVNLMLATKGEADRDMGSYTALNYYGDGSGKLEEDCALVWLADQFGEKEDLLNAVSAVYNPDRDYVDRKKNSDPFMESCIQELENHWHAMGGLTFFLRMRVRDFLTLLLIKKEGKKSIIIPRTTECGIFNPWLGGGGVLEIRLPSDVIVPTSMIWDAWVEKTKEHGYDVDETYGVTDALWHDIGERFIA